MRPHRYTWVPVLMLITLVTPALPVAAGGGGEEKLAGRTRVELPPAGAPLRLRQPGGAEVPQVAGVRDEGADGTVFLPAGGVAVYRLDMTTGQVEEELPELLPLTGDAEDVVEMAPDWLRRHLALTLSYLEDGLQDDLAGLVLELDDDRALDELMFSIAATTPEELAILDSYDILDALVENAVGLYDNDPLVGFADLVDEGTFGVDDDYRTTVSYTYDDGTGARTSWSLTHPDYYRYVVSPKLDMELALFMNPESGSLDLPPEGVFWRRWMMMSSEDPGTFDYRTHYLQETPNEVDDGEPALIPAHGYLTDFGIDPLHVVVDAEGRPVLSEIDHGAGTVLVTTLDLEDAWRDGIEDLAENVGRYIHTRDKLMTSEPVLILVDPDDPSGLMGEAFREMLEFYSLTVTVAGFLDPEAEVLTDYDKLIIPTGGDEVFFSQIGDRLEDIEAFVQGGGTLVLSATPGWAPVELLELPCNVSAMFDTVDGLRFEGHPVLSEVLADTESVWDMVEQQGLSGERALTGDEGALDAIGWWATQNMFDNVSEYDATHADTERSVWPQRILHNHYGNCGEAQDMLTGAGRAALLPMLNVWSLEDHVWNQFLLADQWYAYQVDWSDGPTRIGYGGVGSDGLFGGGKEVSGMLGFRSNGWVENEHIGLYSETISVEVELTDADGFPVDGAMVVAWTDAYYYDDLLDQAAWVHTDQQGRATLQLGDNRNFWIMVRGEVGGEDEAHPFDLDDSTLYAYAPVYVKEYSVGDPFITVEEGVAGASFAFAHEFDEAQGVPVADPVGGEGARIAEVTLSLAVEDTLLDVPAADTMLGWMAGMGYAYGGRLIQPTDEPGTVDLFVVDGAGYEAFLDGEPFEALVVEEGIREVQLEEEIPTDADELFVLVSNRGSVRHLHFVDAELDFVAVPPVEDEGGGDGGCQCDQRGRRAVPGVVLVCSVLGVFGLLRRSGRQRTS